MTLSNMTYADENICIFAWYTYTHFVPMVNKLQLKKLWSISYLYIHGSPTIARTSKEECSVIIILSCSNKNSIDYITMLGTLLIHIDNGHCMSCTLTLRPHDRRLAYWPYSYFLFYKLPSVNSIKYLELPGVWNTLYAT